jgi:TonB family protein
MKITKEKIYGYTGSGVFCLLLFLILYFTVLRAEVKAGEEGVLVNFGTVDLSSGVFEPKSGEPQRKADKPTPPVPDLPTVPTPETRPAVQPKLKQNPDPPITQNREETAALEVARKQREEQKRLEAEQQAQRAKAEAEQRKRDAINQQVSGAFGTGQNQQGTATAGSGIQGNPQSASSVGSSAGSGYGEFSLGGRTLGPSGLPRPAYSVQEEGRIVVNITVDTQGNVIFAEIGKGTNIDNDNMRKSAVEAARKARFNSIGGNNNQSGTITYRYSLK